MRYVAALFLALFTGVGVVGTVAMAIDWAQAVDTYSWEAATCTVEFSRVVERSESGDYAFEVSYRYFQRGEELRSEAFQRGYAGSRDLAETERLAALYAEGAKVPCWVDPDDPSDVYLLRANLWSGLWILVPLLFVVVGAGSLWLLHQLRAPSLSDGRGRASVPSKAAPFKAVGLLVGFFALFFLAGTGILIPFFVVPALRVVEARSWQPVPCEILSSGVRSHSSDDGVTYSVEVLYRYELDGREYRSNRYQFMGGSSSGYESKADAVAKIPAGAEVTCYVDPDDSFEAVLERGFTSDYLFGLIPLLFALVGAGGMVVVVAGARAVKRDAARPSWSGGALPAGVAARPRSAGVPPMADYSGPVVLEPAMGRVGKLGCTLAFALLWNGIVAPFVWIAVQGFRSGNPDWFVTIVMTPFVLIGLLLLSGIPYSILGLVNPKPRVRINRAALRAGESAYIEWSFVGMASRIRRLKIWLESSKVITESTSTDRSASVRTRTEPLGTIEVLERGSEHGVESGTVTFSLPEDALPTSEGDEAVRWKLKLQGDIVFWPDVLEEYEIAVLPRKSAP